MTSEQIAEAKRLANDWTPTPSPSAPTAPTAPGPGTTVAPGTTAAPAAQKTIFPVQRVLTDTTGRKLDATILGKTATGIKCRRTSDGVEFVIDTVKLSLVDQNFIKSIGAEEAVGVEPVKITEVKPSKADTSKITPRETDHPTTPIPPVIPPVIPQLPFEPTAPPKPAIACQLVVPNLPPGVSPVNYRLHLGSGKSVNATLLGGDATKIYFRGPERFLTAVPMSDLADDDRVFISLWLAGIHDQPSVSRTFTIDGKSVLGRSVKMDKDTFYLIQNDGTLLRDLPWRKLSKADQQFLKSWQQKKWINLVLLS